MSDAVITVPAYFNDSQRQVRILGRSDTVSDRPVLKSINLMKSGIPIFGPKFLRGDSQIDPGYG